MNTTIYQSFGVTFVPTRRTVNGKQVWEQIYENKFTGRLWTQEEILKLSPKITKP